jgi:hypothetical protein
MTRRWKIVVAVHVGLFAFSAIVGAFQARTARLILATIKHDPYVVASSLAFEWGSTSDARALLQRTIDHLAEEVGKDPEAGNGFAKGDLKWARVNLAVIDGTFPEVAPGCATREPDGGVMLKGACENWMKRRRVK